MIWALTVNIVTRFHYAVADIEPHGVPGDVKYSEDAEWYLFDYGKRNPLSREAAVLRI